MPLSWSEIKSRANAFAKRWEDAHYEDGQAKPFLIDFFEVFGITDKRVGYYEHAVSKYGGGKGYVDLFIPGLLLVEMKSLGKDLDRAYAQAMDYFPGIKERDLPRYVLVCDFARFRLHDLKEGTSSECKLKELYQNVKSFGFIAGYQTQIIKPQDPINIKAAERMGKLHDALKAVGYEGHPLELYLVRLLFCLFAEDTTIFEKRLFQDYIETKTAEDGSDLAHHLNSLFYVLNTAPDKRLKNLDEHIAAFPYVNGKLFEEPLPPAQFDSKMREALLDLCALDWSIISPAIFGSLFQSIMDVDARRNLGAHYTSEENILKLIKPLFLDALWAEFEKIKGNKNKLAEFHNKLRSLNFIDPACGCGNFLVITYRELRLLELAVLRALHGSGQQVLDVDQLMQINVDQFYGIEIEEFPAQIAQVALWLTDHQMNMRISEEFGNYFARIPLKTTPHIVNGNALQLDWASVLPAERCSYVLGNPPFIGYTQRSAEQKADMELVCHDMHGAGVLDFVAAWYIKAARYISPSPFGRGARGERENSGEGVSAHKLPMPQEHLEFIRSLRENQTDAEQLMWTMLRDRRLADAKFRRQHPVGKYVLDFYCHEAKLAVELDGSQHLDSAHDQTRDTYLQQQGIRVLRYWNNDVLANTDSVLEDIWSVLQAQLLSPAGRRARDEGEMSNGKNIPSPQPSPNGRGGIRCAFVSTNSITQGEQVGVLWGWMLAQSIHIHFAHRTFSWNNEARGKAAVHCVIIGFGLQDVADKTIYEYEDIKGEPHAIKASNINPYLVDAANVILQKASKPICDVPEIRKGSQPTDGGNLLLTEAEKAELIKTEPLAEKWIRPFIGADEFINNILRYCLWLVDCPPNELRQMPMVIVRVNAVKAMRLESKKAPTRELANTPTIFGELRQPKTDYVLIPSHSSENRNFIPIGYKNYDVVSSNANLTVSNTKLWHFGILTSTMHNAWVRSVCGRLESRYRYSASIVYNNFPWPDFPSRPNPSSSPAPLPMGEGGRRSGEGKSHHIIETCAQTVLDARTAHPNASLADLYDPLTMPANLLKAHQALDKAVDAAYGYKGAQTDAARVAFLFERYQQLTSLLPANKPVKARKRKTNG